MTVKRRKQGLDRLSILPVEILIGIISFLPLRLAIMTGSLSRQWRGLWTNVTSINISSHELKHFPEFMTHITSPSMDRFIIELKDSFKNVIWSSPPFDSWLQQASDRNVRELKLAYCYFNQSIILKLPSFIFQIQSLGSLELSSRFDLQLPDQINLPNLKRLWLKEFPYNCLSLETLLKGIPSLEDLHLELLGNDAFRRDIKISNQKLRRLVIHTNHIRNIVVVINAPKLEHLVAHTKKSVIFRFEEKPFSLQEVKIDIQGSYYLSGDENKEISELYGAISNARFLKLNVSAMHNVSTVFRNANQLTLNMEWCHNIEAVLSIIDLCPLLDVLTLISWNISTEDPKATLRKRGRKRTSRRVVKRIEIEANMYNHYHKIAQSFLKLVQHLLSGAIDLKHFHLSVRGPKHFAEKSSMKLRQKEELNYLCNLLCKSYMASREFDVEFVGMFHKYVSNGRSKRLPFNS